MGVLHKLDLIDETCLNIRIRNLREMDRFHSKLVSSDLDKHTSLLQSPYMTNPWCFYSSGPWSHTCTASAMERKDLTGKAD